MHRHSACLAEPDFKLATACCCGGCAEKAHDRAHFAWSYGAVFDARRQAPLAPNEAGRRSARICSAILLDRFLLGSIASGALDSKRRQGRRMAPRVKEK